MRMGGREEQAEQEKCIYTFLRGDNEGAPQPAGQGAGGGQEKDDGHHGDD